MIDHTVQKMISHWNTAGYSLGDIQVNNRTNCLRTLFLPMGDLHNEKLTSFMKTVKDALEHGCVSSRTRQILNIIFRES